MPHFYYRARDDRGVLLRGEFEGEGPDALMDHLSGRGLIPLSIKTGSQGALSQLWKRVTQKRVKPVEVLVMTRQFHTLFKAGMSMEAVLGTLIRQTTNERLKEALRGIQTSIGGGQSLAKSFGNYREIFGDLYISMLAAGEEAGILQEVLGNLATLLDKEIQIKSSVKGATLYPKIVIFVLVAATFVIMNFVVPQFASFYARFGADLPWPTRIVTAVSRFVQQYWYVMGLIAGGLWFAYKKYSRTPSGRLKIGALRFKLPVFGPLNLKVANARFCHILGALYRSGLPMTRCLEITGNTIENGAFQRDMEILKSEVTRGRSISQGMEASHYFTPVTVDAAAVGEKTGSLDEMLDAIGTHYDLEVQYTIKNLTTLLEPILLFGIFGMVTIFVLAVYLPIWNLAQVVLKKT